MPALIGVNLRVTGHYRQGGRKYMEDFFSVAYQQTEDEKDLEYAFIGIYDGHGGAEAAAFAKEHLMEAITKHKNFWSDDDNDVLRAIKDGYIATHYAMWKEQEKWPRTASGLPSTAGTTASVAFIRRGKIYIGHAGDSGIVLGYEVPHIPGWKALPLTRDHKPENSDEISRIEECGGKVVAKSGVPRVVWNRPKIGHQGPVRRSTPIDEIPFLAVARSLGDFWSYNSRINQFVVSPEPDCTVIKIDTNSHRCLIFGTDGLYNMLSPSMAVQIVQNAEMRNEAAALKKSPTCGSWVNPSRLLVENALERWQATKMRADNTSVVTLMLDPPGPPRAQVLKERAAAYPLKELNFEQKSRESTSFDPRTEIEEAPQASPSATEVAEVQDCNKENNCQKENNSIEDDNIQINEVTSSSVDSVETSVEGICHNLRLRKPKVEPEVKKDVAIVPETASRKRKLSPAVLRKSMRLDGNQKKVVVPPNKIKLRMVLDKVRKVSGRNKVSKKLLFKSQRRFLNADKPQQVSTVTTSSGSLRRSTRGLIKVGTGLKKTVGVKSLTIREKLQKKTASLRKNVKRNK